MNQGSTHKGLALFLGLCLITGIVSLAMSERQPPEISPDEPPLPEWVARMRSSSPDVRYEARRGLIRMGDAAIPTLVALLDDDRPDARYEAIAALCQIRTPNRATAIPSLIRILRQRDPELQRVAIEALRSMGPLARSAATPLKELFWEPAPDLNGPTAKSSTATYIPLALACIEGGEAVPFLIEALSAPHSRHETVFALAKIGPSAQAALPHLRALTQDASSSPFLKHSIARAIERIEQTKDRRPPINE
jgi:HEAT repeat protein